MFSRLCTCTFALVVLAGVGSPVVAQSASTPQKSSDHEPVSTLEQDFFAALREGNSDRVLSYVSEGGVNVGQNAQHETRQEVEQQLQTHQGLYCKLFDSSCIHSAINLGNSARSCSYRELLTHSETVHTASSELTREGVQQAVLVARVQNKQCPSDKLIDFIFNLNADGWKLFSIP